MKKVIFFLIASLGVASAQYDDFYDKNSSPGSHSPYYDDKGVSVDIGTLYDDKGDNSTIPDGVDKEDKAGSYGYDLGGSLRGKITTEKGLGSFFGSLKNGSGMETLGDTYICPADNVTYDSLDDCRTTCMSVCDKYKFTASISCQNAREVLKITAENFGANPPLLIKYQDKVYRTQKVDAVCGNGYMSSGIAYEWSFTKDGLNFLIPASMQTLGECKDLKGIPFISEFNKYYDFIGKAFQAHLSKLGYNPYVTVNGGDLSLSVNAIFTGACDDNSLTTSLPNKEAITKMQEGRLDFSEAQRIAQVDTKYSLITDGTDMEAKTCIVNNGVKLYSNSRTFNEVLVFKGDLPDVTKRDKGSTHVYNNGTLIGIVQNGRYEKDYLSEITERFLSSSLEIGAFTASNGDTFIGCPGNPLPDGTSCKIEDRWINSTVPYSFSVTVEKLVTEDVFEVIKSDTCGDVGKCQLYSETVCDLFGGNCVSVTQNGISTGQTPSKFCNNVDTMQDSYMVCSDGKTITAKGNKKSFSAATGYFTVNRSYVCENSEPLYDVSSWVEQDKTISDSMTVTDKGDVSFSAIGADGKLQNYKTNVSLNDTKCQLACKVQAPGVIEPIIGKNGETITPNTVTVKGETKVLPQSYYKSCIQKNEKWRCELEGEEKLISDCECPNNFLDVIVQIKLLDESGKSMKCSSK